jgi:hypothetical protein
MTRPDPKLASHSPHGFNQVANISSLILLVVVLLYAWLDPAGFKLQVAKDGIGHTAGWFEHLTVIVLIPGILAGLYAFWRYRHRLPSRVLGYWLLAWVLACIFFAGEEASWGQWYFQWEAPEVFAKLNPPRETNIHNIGSSWLNEKPRALIELFVFVAGFLIPLYGALSHRLPIIRRGFLADWEGWIYAPVACLSAALLYMVVRIAKWLPQYAFDNLGHEELREFCIAWFLMWYLISFLVRLARMSRPDLKVASHSLHGSANRDPQ